MSRVEQFLLGGSHSSTAVHVGLVNNMPDASLRATELQFARLLKEASGGLDVRLRLFSLRAIPRDEGARTRMAGFYDDAAFLPAATLDALIVTGFEPGTSNLRDEPFWQELTQLIDWAETGTLSTLFSANAAEAAVLHLDDIAAQPLPVRLSGIYESIRVEDDPLFFNTVSAVPVPHSRRGQVAESDLLAKGYRILARLGNGQADIFTREPPGQSRFVFLQGHPEYDPATLGREYLRDLERFLDGATQQRPALPEHYFDRATELRLAELKDSRELPRYQEIVLGALPRQAWRSNTVRLIGNWLTLVAAAKARRMASKTVHTRRRAS
ncbi:MAG TPA: homoserine O-succinyltransferase [Rhizomicrobium sp.]|nr:homoserine O-succinyltransferase [Rhizomicrobium sp.]